MLSQKASECTSEHLNFQIFWESIPLRPQAASRFGCYLPAVMPPYFSYPSDQDFIQGEGGGGEREREREGEVGRGREGKREIWSLKEAILFVGGVRE